MKIIQIILVITFAIFSSVFADRPMPKDVSPIIHDEIKYVVSHWDTSGNRFQNGGYIEAWDNKTNKLLWVLKIYTIEYDNKIERDVQDIFITKVEVKDGKLIILNEANDEFTLDLKTKEISPENKIYKK
ncbi:MAG: hypothetical protein PHO70_07605 [Candidatus Omnitrophica bacterium]|nr:hypothetical protein [Candidatus Omnitrophota bacterium]